MFDLAGFKADCCAAVTERAGLPAIREVVARAVEVPEAVVERLLLTWRAAVSRFGVVLATGILVIACASVPIAPRAALVDARSFNPAPGKARLYVFRPPGFAGSAVVLQVAIDGRIVGATAPGTFVMIEVDPGRHVVSSQTAENLTSVPITVEAGRLYFIRQEPRFGLASARVSLEQANENEGRDAVLKSGMVQGVSE